MTLPGFTAEGSLYRTSEQYQTAYTHQQIQGTVYPAQSNRTGCTISLPVTLTFTECCVRDASGCLSCQTIDQDGNVWKSSVSDCPPPPRCEPSSTWKWDENGCKDWTIVHEDCREEDPHPITDCPEPVTPPNRGTQPPVFLTR